MIDELAGVDGSSLVWDDEDDEEIDALNPAKFNLT